MLVELGFCHAQLLRSILQTACGIGHTGGKGREGECTADERLHQHVSAMQ
jgi:hypothetical protein